jgi:phage anti-repressor protein
MASSQSVQVPGENLIPVFTAEIGGVSTLAVNARDLHGFLGVKRGFSAWIKSRIIDFGFVKNQDFLVSEIYDTKQGRGGNKKSVIGYILQGRGGNNESVIEYILTLDMAKELSMVERSEKSRIVRKYFIECERKLHEAQCISEQDLGYSETEIQDSRETEEERLLNEAILDRILFWTLEKRDAIFHPGVDRRILF